MRSKLVPITNFQKAHPQPRTNPPCHFSTNQNQNFISWFPISLLVFFRLEWCLLHWKNFALRGPTPTGCQPTDDDDDVRSEKVAGRNPVKNGYIVLSFIVLSVQLPSDTIYCLCCILRQRISFTVPSGQRSWEKSRLRKKLNITCHLKAGFNINCLIAFVLF